MSKRIAQYRYNVGDIIQTDKIHYEVLQQTRIERPKYNTSMKSYKIRCLKCGYEHEYSQAQILSNYGCGVCDGKIIVRGINSIQDTAPWMVDWLSNHQDAYKYAPQSNVYVQAKCPDCGYKKIIKLPNLYCRHGFKCPICSDGKSFPERFLTNLFLMYDIDFIPQLTSKYYPWIERNRYDFFLPHFNTIVQAHGGHHYKESKDFVISGKEQQKRDAEKRKLALKNGIQSYIEIDFSKDELDFIKQKIIESGLLDIIGISSNEIDWKQIFKRATQSIIKKVCDHYNETKDYNRKIAKLFGINPITVSRYLQKGTTLGWVEYAPKFGRKLS